MRELGGSISVDSEPGRGTVMSIALPLFEAHQASALQMSSAEMSADKLPPLLIVEDDLALQKQIKWSLDRFESRDRGRPRERAGAVPTPLPRPW